MEAIWREGDYPHQGNQSHVLRLLVFSAERSTTLPQDEVPAVAISHGAASTQTSTRLDSTDPQARQAYCGVTKTSADSRRFLSIRETADYTGLSRHTLYTMVSQRRIPYIKMGRLTKFDVALLNAWIKQNTVMPILRKTA
jgi:excisionase family DNA binding protein